MADDSLRNDLAKMSAQFRLALPAHIPVDKFVRVVLTAINSRQELLRADRRTLFESATKAAQDGLLPDGREATFTVFKTNIGTKANPKWIDKVQYMPMVGGICKRVRNSKEIAVIDAQVVYERDEYDSWTDEHGAHFKHKKAKKDRGAPILTYAYALSKDGSVFFEELSEDDIEAIRNVSKAKDSGPWASQFADEMRRKSAIRRLAKYRLPSTADIDQIIRRDDEMYDLSAGDPLAELSAPTQDELPAHSLKGKQEELDGPAPEAIRDEVVEAIQQATGETFPDIKAYAHKQIALLKNHEKLILEITRVLNNKQDQLSKEAATA